jgi:hypothetical protein
MYVKKKEIKKKIKKKINREKDQIKKAKKGRELKKES